MKKRTQLEKKASQLRKELLKKTGKIRKRLKNVERRQVVSLLIVIGLVISALYYFRGQFIVAVVNGRPISRLALIKELEKQAGQNALNSLVTKTLILQEVKKQKITISDIEVDEEIKQIELTLSQQGQDLNQLLAAKGISQENLKEDIKIQKMVEKIAVQDIEVADEEIEEYFEQRKDAFPADISPEEIKETLKQQLEQEKMNEAVQSWVNSLHEKAKIEYLLIKPPVENL